MLAVFCDFDGTLMVEEIGWSLAQQSIPERIAMCERRYLAGDFTSWELNHAIFEGAEIGIDQIEAWVQAATLDPGARSLLAWCRQRKIPFQVLSDGFDLYIEAMKRHYKLSFPYQSNHLEIQEGKWKTTAGCKQPVHCYCGNGLCKASCIREFRVQTPNQQIVYIGNSPFSDACAATEADLVFAKDSLAEYLDQEGHEFFHFTTLNDVVAELERKWGEH